ncbi:MAG: hypothetical protein AMJ53_06515 [Gammaproteobacteria bacterium SG8_11]|nr:MAG: hypothetical protein AMJ53_06515 [Gammaproteobacteria bacterium SG8_11]
MKAVLTMKIYLALFYALFFTACATQKPNYDYLAGADFGNYSTYAWLSVGKESTDNHRSKNPLIDQRIVGAIDNALAAKGLRKVSDNSDMLINYHVSVSQQEQQQPRGRVSIGSSRYSGSSSLGFAVSVPVGGTRTYQEGTLVIDMVDAKTKDLLWQGWGSRTVRQDTDPERLTALINEVVAEVLANYPPATK